MTEQVQLTPAQRRRVMLIIWSSFCSALLIYLAVLVLALRHRTPAVPQAELYQLIFPLIAVVLAGASMWWRRRATEQLTRPTYTTMGTADTDTLEQFQTACIITWALSEAVAIHGLVLGFLLQDVDVYLPFGVGGLLLLFIHRPMAWPQWKWLV